MRIIFFLLLLTSFAPMYAQYTWTKRVFTDNTAIQADEVYYMVTGSKGRGENMNLYLQTQVEGKLSLIIRTVDLNTLRSSQADTIIGLEPGFVFKDFVPGDRFESIVGYSKLLVYDRVLGEVYNFSKDSVEFRFAHPFADSIILLYDFYDYHPLDGFSGLQMHLFDLSKRGIVKSAYYKFPGIAFSHMTINWAAVSGGYIYAFSPLTGKRYRYDGDLRPVDTVAVDFAFKEPEQNERFEKTTGNVMVAERNRLLGLYKKYGVDSIRRSPKLSTSEVYTKDYLTKTSQKLRTEYEFIEKILPCNDSLFVISVSKPSSTPLKFRDILFYDVKANKVVGRIRDWRCSKADTADKFESYFTVDVINDAKSAPYFHNGKVYFVNFFNIALFTPGVKNDLDKRMLKDVMTHNYHMNIIEYDYGNRLDIIGKDQKPR